MKKLAVYGIGSPLMDILVNIKSEELSKLKLNKGIMHIINGKKREELLSFIENKDKNLICGGDTPNTIIALANLGMPTALSGRIGNDEYGNHYRKKLKELKIISNLKEGTLPTGTSIILISEDSERTMGTYLGVCQHFNEEDIDKELISNSKYIHFTGYMWGADAQKRAVMKAIKIAKANSTGVIFDVADPFIVKNNKEDLIKLIKENVDIVFANKEESRILLDIENPEEAINKLSKLCNIAVVKIGSEGALIKQKNEQTIFIPSRRVNVIDTTGAGDNFAAGFIYGLCNNMSLQESGIFASYLASHIVSNVGAQLSEKTKKEILLNIKKGSWNYIRGG
ncbi:adenosine kinase [Candidatus Woesearchaeota archaeon]|nr:adenosine kinase [Candidatus Woesearchaeota archaeon]